jgi:UDP-2-acetamido-3-amino-2,3-dideoxy-glucuronate N-acetyltransferase
VGTPPLTASDRAPGLLLGEGVIVPDDAELGAYVVIHAGTAIGAGVRIQDGAVLGKPPAFGARSKASREEPPPLVVAEGATIGADALVAAGAAIGPAAMVGDMAHVRERAAIGRESLVGSRCSIDNDVVIGARVRIQTGAYITAFSELEDDVFVAPYVVTSNDRTAGRRPPQSPLRGARLRRGCRVGAGAVLLPGVEVGEEAFVGAGAVVTRNVAPRSLVVGSPARHVREVGPAEDVPLR